MAKVKRSYTNPAEVLKKLSFLINSFKEQLQTGAPNLSPVLHGFTGSFESEIEEVGFDSVDEYPELFRKIDFAQLTFAFINFEFKTSERERTTILDCTIVCTESSVRLRLGAATYPEIENVFRRFEEDFPQCELLTYDPEEEDKARRASMVERCVEILQRLPEYQTRLRKAFEGERELQDFLYPVLKSHFPDLVDEEFMHRVASAGSKPDFAIPSASLLVECKFMRNKQDFKDFRDQIAADLLGYFTNENKYEQMIVVIYNIANLPMPANYIADLETADKRIKKVIISPGMQPEVRQSTR